MFASALAIGSSIFGAVSAKKAAQKQQSAANKNAADVKELTAEQIEKVKALESEKLNYLQNGDIFGDMGGYVFGDAGLSVLKNLRQAQSDNSALAAGDTSAFSKEVERMVSSSLANTFGAPRGSFENMSTKNLMALKNQGLANSTGLAKFFEGVGSNLLSYKFGIMDRSLDTELGLRQNETAQVNNYRSQAAQLAGVEDAGFANILSSAAQAYSGYQAGQAQKQALAYQQDFQSQYLKSLIANTNRQYGGQSKTFSGGGSLPTQSGYESSDNGYIPNNEFLPMYSAPDILDTGVANRGGKSSYASYAIAQYLNPALDPMVLPDASNADPNTQAGKSWLDQQFNQ